jgi:enoyl-CoA hydratase
LGPTVRTSRDGEIFVIVIDRPESRNAINAAIAAELEEAIHQLDADPELKVGILTGTEGCFSSGMDLRDFAAGRLPLTEQGGFAGMVKRPPGKVIIAAIEGFALAGGLELALACDLIVAARDAELGLPEVKVGLTAGAGGLLRLSRRLPYHVAMELAVGGGTIGAERAHALGLVNRLTDPDAALAGALELARGVAANAPLAVLASKRVLIESRDWSESEGWDLQDELVKPVVDSDDAKEGVAAFSEKRPPTWKGR